MHPKITKGLSLGLGFQFFEYLGFEFGFEYFANLLQISNKTEMWNRHKNLSLRMTITIV
jgi:hypothetical protein